MGNNKLWFFKWLKGHWLLILVVCVLCGFAVKPVSNLYWRLAYQNNAEHLKKTRLQVSKMMQGNDHKNSRIIIGLIGDSWSTDSTFYIDRLARDIIPKLGDGGVGWFGFGFTGTMQAPVITGDARRLYDAHFGGSGWSSNYHSGSSSPNISDIRSTTVGDVIEIESTLGASHPALSAVMLHYTATEDGVVRWRWNKSRWSNPLKVQGRRGDQSAVNLYDFPLKGPFNAARRAITLEIEVVAGSVILNGLDFQSTTNGIVFHKLGSSGSKASDWTRNTNGQWEMGISKLGLTAAQIMLGTNDLFAEVPPETFANSVEDIAVRLRRTSPDIELLFIAPPENMGPHQRKMKDYAALLSLQGKKSKAAFLDLQPVFGDAQSPLSYGPNSKRPLFIDFAHPNANGGALVANKISDNLLVK
jgi:lysophospholipase L1-like esterase